MQQVGFTSVKSVTQKQLSGFNYMIRTNTKACSTCYHDMPGSVDSINDKDLQRPIQCNAN